MATESSAAAAAGFWGRHENVYVYIPNLIGYVRVVVMLISFTVAKTSPLTCVGLYFLGFALDETDGRAARAFNQTSTFGTVLDMVTDRVATSGLLMVLCIVYPDGLLLFQLLLILDIFSHWLQMYAASLTGVTHKDAESKSWLVRIYYKYRIFMGFCCVCVEVLYLSAYLLHWQHAEHKPWGTVPLPFIKSLPGGAELLSQAIPHYWREEGIPVLFFVALAATPGFIIKQATNVFQIKAAARKMVAYDNGKKER
eukprot:jgi/Tetstr1/423310/TSEL_014008.t1